MLTLLALLPILALTGPAQAGVKVCVATLQSEPDYSTQFTIDWELNGTRLTFDKQVAWHPENLVFDVIYSSDGGVRNLIVATSPRNNRHQMVEIEFERTGDRMTRGILRAGDQAPVMRQMAKNRTYNVECN